jgi:hypothetical protein
LDIETRPALVYTWQLYEPHINIEMVKDPGGVFCFAAKFLESGKMEFLSDHHDGHEAMIKRAWELLDETDAVLHFNGASFDEKHLNREFMEHHLPPPSPYKTIDLYKTVKKRAKFLSNKLAWVGPRLGLEGKVKHEGFGLWLKCMDGNETAWRNMKRYNVRDVTELEELYLELRPWIPAHPNHAVYNGADCCPYCGSTSFQFRGTFKTQVSTFRKRWCKICGGWSRVTKQDPDVPRAGVVQIS